MQSINENFILSKYDKKVSQLIIRENLRTKDNIVVSIGITMAGKGTGGIIVCVTVCIGTGLFENSRVVMLPHTAFACLWCAMSTSATVFVSVELHAGTHTGDSV